MEDINREFSLPDKRLAAVCGLLCSACAIFIGTMEEPERLDMIAKRRGLEADDLRCNGCRSDKRGSHCQKCQFISCAAEKGVDFCGECLEYPCDELTRFQAAMPHRAELWEAHKSIKEKGYQTWYKETTERYTCPKCQTINSAYDLACRKCGNTPSCAYVDLHQQEIIRRLESGK